MRMFKIAVHLQAVVVLAACGSEKQKMLGLEPGPDADPAMDAGTTADADTDVDAGVMPDASPSPDAPPDAPPAPPPPLERLDWRSTRGDPMATVSAVVPTADLFAMNDGGFVTRAQCDGLQGCTFTWHDATGMPLNRREHMTAVTSSTLSPDGSRALLVSVASAENCTDGSAEFPVVDGTLQLLDLGTGAASFELAIRSNLWSAPAFTPLGDGFFAAPINDKRQCQATVTGLRSTAPPFATPPGLVGGEFVQMVDPRRWAVFHGADLGVADPAVQNSFQFLANDPSRFDVTHGWIHVYVGFADLAQDVVSISPTGATRQTTLRDQDWHPFGALGRWIRVCRIIDLGIFDCRVVDALAETAPVNFRISSGPAHPDDAVLLDGAVVFVGPLESGELAVQRIDLVTGQHDVLHPGTGTLRALGDGAGALLLQNGSAWAIEARTEELVTGRVTRILNVPRTPALATRTPGRQDDVAVLVTQSDAGQFTLVILDMRTRRVATVSENLHSTPVRGVIPADDCGQPWIVRHGGNVVEGLSQQVDQLFFVELGDPASLWLVPIALSAPPRRLATLGTNLALCRPPLASPEGRRVGFAELGPDGTTTRITVSSSSLLPAK